MKRNKLRTLRFFNNLTQYDLAQVTQIPQSKISLLENGYQSPKPEEAMKLGEALKVDPEELLEDFQKK